MFSASHFIIHSIHLVLKVTALAFLLITSSFVHSSETLIWGTDVWDGYTNTDGSGFYHELITQIFDHSDYAVKPEYLSWKRSLSHLENGETDFTGSLPKSPRFLFSKHPIIKDTVYRVYRRDHTQICCDTESSLGSYRMGYDKDIFANALPNHQNAVSVNSVEQGFELVLSGKTDFYVELASMIKHASLDIQSDLFVMQEIQVQDYYWAFSKSDKGKELKTFFDNKMQALIASGELDKLYAKYGLVNPRIKSVPDSNKSITE